MSVNISRVVGDNSLYVYTDQNYPYAIIKLKPTISINTFDNINKYTDYLFKDYKSRNIYFLSYGNDRFKNSIVRIEKEAEQMNIFTKILCYKEEDLDSEFTDVHGEFVKNNQRGGGYWIWKPYLVKKTLQELNDNDILVYVDSGSVLNQSGLERLKEYFDIIDKSKYGILSFQLPYLEKNWTKNDIFKHFNSDQSIKDAWQLMATAFIIKKCPHSCDLVNKWYENMHNYKLIDDSPSETKNSQNFMENRHDQSIFSVLRNTYGSEIITDETSFPFIWDNFNDYPIHAKRLRF